LSKAGAGEFTGNKVTVQLSRKDPRAEYVLVAQTVSDPEGRR